MLSMFSARGAADNLRLNAMSDGVFAIVMTLMVFDVKVPRVAPGELTHALVESWPAIATMLLSFVLLGIYWIGHNNVFQHVLKHDRVMLWLNILFLLVVALIPYCAGMLIRHGSMQIAHAVYAGVLAACGFLLDLIWWHATYHKYLMCDSITPELIKAFHFRILTGPLLYVVAIAISFVSLPVTRIVLGLAAIYYLIPTAQDFLHHRQLERASEQRNSDEGGKQVGEMQSYQMKDTVTQVSILDALLASKFDGCLSCRELLKYGDFGIGTFDRMDGEMIIVDGRLYQGKADGKVVTPDPDISTPFATVCYFHPDLEWKIDEPINIDALKKMIEEKASNKNVFCAIRVEGSFSYVKTQVLPIQTKPYPPVARVVKSCPHFEMKDVSGTIVGFRSPPYVKGINDPGYHLHFLSDDRTWGGHLLTCVMDRGACAIDICSNHVVMLPEDGTALVDIDLSKDLVKEFEESLASSAAETLSR